MLTDAAIKAAIKATGKAAGKGKRRQLTDADGLMLIVGARGGVWYLRRSKTIDEKLYYQMEKIGKYPEIGIKEARMKAAILRIVPVNIQGKKFLEESKRKFLEKSSEIWTFDKAFEEFISFNSQTLKETYIGTLRRRYSKNIPLVIKNMDIEKIQKFHFQKILEDIQDRGKSETANKIKKIITQVLQFAHNKGVIDFAKFSELTNLDQILRPHKAKSYPTFSKDEDIAKLLKDIENDKKLSLSTKYCLKLAPHIFLRANEMVNLKWEFVDFKKKIIQLPEGFTKTKKVHFIPISQIAEKILIELKELHLSEIFLFPKTLNGKIFPDETISAVAPLHGLEKIGYKNTFVFHSFRSMFRTVGNENISLSFLMEDMELQLQHEITQPNGTAYNRAARLIQRAEMMNKWSNYLQGLLNEI